MAWTAGSRVKVTNTGQSYTTHPNRVSFGCVESKFTENVAPSDGQVGIILQHNPDHNSCAIEINGRHFLVGCAGLEVIGGADTAANTSGSSSSEVEWNTQGFWEKTEGAAGGSALRFFITKTNLADAPYIHIKRIHLKDLNGDPVLFTAHCSRTLKKSRHQTDVQAQDMVEGKYRPARLAEPPPTTRTKWAAVAPKANDPAILELRPVGRSHFPLLSGFSFDNGIRTSRYPATWLFQSLQGTTWKTLQSVDDCPGSFCESFISLPPQVGAAFRALPPLFEAIASQDEATCLRALRCAGGTTWSLGNLTNLDEVLQAVVATKNLRLLTIFTTLGRLPAAAVKAAFLTGQEELVRFVCRSQGVTRSLFKYALAARSLATFDYLAGLNKRIVRDEEAYIVSSAGSSREVLAHVVAHYARLAEEKPEELPDYPALRSPNAKILRSALLGGDVTLFLQLAGRADAAVLAAFLDSAVTKRLPVTADIVQGLLDLGVPLVGIFDALVDNERIDLAQLLLSNGVASSSGLDGALWRSLLAGREAAVDLLLSYGASCPAGPVFAQLLAEPPAFETAGKAIAILTRHGLFDANAVSASSGLSLIEQAIAKDAKHPLVPALLQNGASATLPSGESVYKLLAERFTSTNELLALLTMCGPSDGVAKSIALLRFVALHSDSLPSVDDLRRFKEAGADFNFVKDGQSVLTALVRNKHFARATFDAAVAMGADPLQGPELDGIALCNDAVPEEDFQYLSSLRPRDPIELLWTLVLETKLYKKATVRATAVFEQLLATDGLNLTITRPIPSAAKRKSTTTTGCNHQLFSLLHRNVSEKACASCSATVGGDVRCWWCPVLDCETVYFCDGCTEDHQSYDFPLITAACLLQLKPKAFLALYDRGARQPADFNNPQKDFLLWLCSGLRLSGKGLKTSLDSPEEVDKFISFVSEPAVLPPAKLLTLFLETVRKDVRASKAEEFLALCDREDFDAGYQPTPFFPTPLVSALKRHASAELIAKLIEKGANVPQLEAQLNDSLLGYVVHFYGKKAPSRGMRQVFKLLLDAGADYKRRFHLAAAPHRGLPASHFLCVRSGKESHKAEFKACVRELLAKGMDINAKMTYPDLAGDTSSFWEFVRATPMDCNYAGNENLQRFFRKRDGVREYANRANPL